MIVERTGPKKGTCSSLEHGRSLPSLWGGKVTQVKKHRKDTFRGPFSPDDLGKTQRRQKGSKRRKVHKIPGNSARPQPPRANQAVLPSGTPPEGPPKTQTTRWRGYDEFSPPVRGSPLWGGPLREKKAKDQRKWEGARYHYRGGLYSIASNLLAPLGPNSTGTPWGGT